MNVYGKSALYDKKMPAAVAVLENKTKWADAFVITDKEITLAKLSKSSGESW